jgi:GrpB-like predicted nucleotidyltransferase (UPF0157 family)
MLIFEQEKWIEHLSDTDAIFIVPFDATTEEKFQRIKAKIQEALGGNVRVEHHGASSLGISGQDEIDVYIPTAPDSFDEVVDSLKGIFGEPRSLYPLRRARFVTEEEGKHIDIFPINEESDDWKDLVKFETILRNDPIKLGEYRKLKESGNGLTTREYYRRKIEYINEILKEKIKTAGRL